MPRKHKENFSDLVILLTFASVHVPLQTFDSAFAGGGEALQAPLAPASVLPLRCGLWRFPECAGHIEEPVPLPTHQHISAVRGRGQRITVKFSPKRLLHVKYSEMFYSLCCWKSSGMNRFFHTCWARVTCQKIWTTGSDLRVVKLILVISNNIYIFTLSSRDLLAELTVLTVRTFHASFNCSPNMKECVFLLTDQL